MEHCGAAAKAHSVSSGQAPQTAREVHYWEGYRSVSGITVQFQSDWTKQHQLEGDGLLTLLYDHLWKSDKAKEHHLKCALIPDTVVFEHNFPRAWYAYDTKTSEIIKRPGRLLDANSIYSSFASSDDNEIVAQFYYRTYTKAATSTQPQRSPRKGEGARGRKSGENGAEELATSVEFFTTSGLHDFLHQRKFKPDGVLQRFLLPKGNASSRRNFQIQAIWSPRVLRVYKRTNRFRLNDRSATVEERAATFDGPPHLSTESLVARNTWDRVEEICGEIVEHFKGTEKKPITRIILYFKMDDADRLWVLWASSLRIGGDELNPCHLRVPLHIALKVNTATREDVETQYIDSRDHEANEHATAGSRRKIAASLLNNDVKLYDMTGDWIFAKTHCSQHTHFIGSRPQMKSPPRVPLLPAPPEYEPTTPPATARCRYHEEERSHLSPRAPFFPTTRRQVLIPPASPRHPLHDLYCELDQDASKGQHANVAGASKGWRMSLPSSAPANSQSGAMSDTKMAKLKADLKALARDLVYENYSTTLSITAESRVDRIVVELPEAIRIALSAESIDSLLNVLHFTAEDDVHCSLPTTVLARGRRQDRPVAQLMKDVDEFFDKTFADDASGIALRWKEYEETKDKVLSDET